MPDHKPSPRAGDFSWKRELQRLADDWPLASRAIRGVNDGQRRALIELQQQLAEVSDEAENERQPSLSELFEQRLAAAEQATPALAREALYRRTIEVLVPDEILMLVQLVAQGEAPLAHIGVAFRPFGRLRERVLEYATPLGRDAGVSLTVYVGFYVRHLRSLGLVDVLPAESGSGTGFERLRAETDVREAIEKIRATSGQYIRFERRNLRPSVFARELMLAVDHGNESPPSR